MIEQIRRAEPRSEYHIRYAPPILEPGTIGSKISTPAVVSGTAGMPPPPSPGIVVGTTHFDQQSVHSIGHQIARAPHADVVQFVWNFSEGPDEMDHWEREVTYNAYRFSNGTLAYGTTGTMLGYGYAARPGYPNIAVNQSNVQRVVLEQRDDWNVPLHTWHFHFSAPGIATHADYDLPSPAECGETNFPKFTVHHNTSPELKHIVSRTGLSCEVELVVYWRFNDSFWEGPIIIDSSSTSGHVVTSDANSGKVAIVLHSSHESQFGGANNIAYYESSTYGGDWLDGTGLGAGNKSFVTSYADTASGPQAWFDIATSYDNSGVLHIVWNEQVVANKSNAAFIRHWNSSRGTIRPVAYALWDAPLQLGAWNLNVSRLSMGIGDGSSTCDGEANLNYLYVLYTQFSGPTALEQEDHSTTGRYNGELYLTSSNNGGLAWSPSANLTNTKTPNCRAANPDSVCRSENWASISRAVSDIDIMFISDQDPGAILAGEGSWQPNPVHYLNLPGGGIDQQYVCPVFAANFAASVTADIECEYHAAPNEIKSNETVTVANLGNAALSGTISVLPGASWLIVNGAGPYSIQPAAQDLQFPITMNASGLSEGLYSGTIRITHDAPNVPSPYDIPINFFVITDFNCAEATVMSTGVE